MGAVTHQRNGWTILLHPPLALTLKTKPSVWQETGRPLMCFDTTPVAGACSNVEDACAATADDLQPILTAMPASDDMTDWTKLSLARLDKMTQAVLTSGPFRATTSATHSSASLTHPQTSLRTSAFP